MLPTSFEFNLNRSLHTREEGMRRVLFSWRGARIYAYPVMLYLGVTAGVIAGTYVAALRGLNATRSYVAMLLLSAAALAGARLLFVASHWQDYRREPHKIWRHSEGGYVLYGGLLLALAFSVPLLRALRIPLETFWDAAAINILTGMVFTKLGCFLNGCCAGRQTSGFVGMNLPDARGVWRRRIPAQLIEAALAAILLFGAVKLLQRVPPDGVVFLSATAAYAISRCLLESAREGVGGLCRITLARAISIGLGVASLAMLTALGLHFS
jgi:phosphatidylglycerol---prolipoprotein diacylglyceryl transferase